MPDSITFKTLRAFVRQEWDSIICCNHKPQAQVLCKKAKSYEILAEKRQFWKLWLILTAEHCISSWQPKDYLWKFFGKTKANSSFWIVQVSWTNVKSATSRSGELKVQSNFPKNIALKVEDLGTVLEHEEKGAMQIIL